mmetsp:Transcript_2859/g.9632  ORF Transcript_2859/g.9632 Transcript_2859/m.9632 type:complete len:97 (+) Transcript_2859:608-898(+)
MLEDVGTSLLSREERLVNTQHSLVCSREAGRGAPPDVDVEQLRLELMAAELSERAWRERSASLAGRKEELLAKMQSMGAARAGATALGAEKQGRVH